MLRFNTLFAAANLDPSTIRLVRHRDPTYHRAIYDDAIRRSPRFEEYQSGQGNPRVIAMLRSAKILAAYVVDPRGQTVFVGLWRVLGFRDAYIPDPYRALDPAPKGTPVAIDLQRMTELDEYSGRIIVDWGGGERAWVQYADRQDKQILEIRRETAEETFPGFARFGCGLHEIDGLPGSWLEPLRATRGVYLLVQRATGAQYVGSATGIDGFVGRWRSYSNGHGGNVRMRELSHAAEDYDVRILETVGSGAGLDDIYALETLWKDKLGSRVQGLNRN